MILEMYSIKDRLQKFIPPVPMSSEEVAQRWFKEMMHENITMRMQPEDFSLWKLGEWDSDTGEWTSDIKEVVYNGKISDSF